MAPALVFLSRIAAPRQPAIDTDIEEAREALEYWSLRATRLPWHRRAARREARELATRWRGRLIRAHLERWRLGRFERVLVPVLDTRGRSRARHAGWLAWTSMRRTVIGRRILFGVTAVAVAAVACFALVVAAAAQLVV